MFDAACVACVCVLVRCPFQFQCADSFAKNSGRGAVRSAVGNTNSYQRRIKTLSTHTHNMIVHIRQGCCAGGVSIFYIECVCRTAAAASLGDIMFNSRGVCAARHWMRDSATTGRRTDDARTTDASMQFARSRRGDHCAATVHSTTTAATDDGLLGGTHTQTSREEEVEDRRDKFFVCLCVCLAYKWRERF